MLKPFSPVCDLGRMKTPCTCSAVPVDGAANRWLDCSGCKKSPGVFSFLLGDKKALSELDSASVYYIIN